jgi:hypothetical protein
MMQQEAEITINGTRLTNNEARMVRLALASFAEIMANQLGFKDDGIPLTDQYQADTAHVLALIEGRAQRTQWIPQGVQRARRFTRVNGAPIQRTDDMLSVENLCDRCHDRWCTK